MGIFHVFYIVQMVPNRTKCLICSIRDLNRYINVAFIGI